MKRRSFLGFLLAAPIAAPVIAKSLAAQEHAGTAFTIEAERFTVKNIDGVPCMTIRGDLIADGSITVRTISVQRLSPISANLGETIPGILRA